jgi:hypothetical protein
MDAKLTLTIEQSLISRAKEYAKGQGRSLSDLVENYFKLLISDDYPIKKETPDIISELRGSFQAPEGFDYKKALQEEIIKKHL